MIRRKLVDRLYSASNTRRWTDHACPSTFTTMGKNAHMMSAAWLIGKLVEQDGTQIDWRFLIETGIFRTLRTCVLTDIKPQVFSELMRSPKSRRALNGYARRQLLEDLGSFDSGFSERMVSFFSEDNGPLAPDQLIAHRIIRAASFHATRWEYAILRPLNPSLEDEVSTALANRGRQHAKLLRLLDRPDGGPERFLDMCGRLRFDERWNQTPITPARPVLDHELVVAVLAYLCSIERGAGVTRSYNNFFGALFHDFGEALTRDIISPVKGIAEDVAQIIKEYEDEQIETRVLCALPDSAAADFGFWISREFGNKFRVPGSHEWSPWDGADSPNEEDYQVYDGRLIKGCDSFAAYMEAYYSIKFGTVSSDLVKAMTRLFERRKESERYGADFEVIYELCYHDAEPILRVAQ